MENIPKKKRGRKPKNLNRIITPKVNNTISPIITHLSISDNESDAKENNNDNLFKLEKDNRIFELENEIKKLKKKINKNIFDCKESVYQVKFDNKSTCNCWWCKHSFDNSKIELPINYYNNTFYTYGIFCSYECCQAYNIDLNDENVFKRSSLLKFHYYKTFGEFKNIKKAKDWKILSLFGGNVSIEEFRNSFENINDYNYLKPPMISRYGNIEKINLVKNNNNNNKLVIKRSKPLKNNKNTLCKFISNENT